MTDQSAVRRLPPSPQEPDHEKRNDVDSGLRGDRGGDRSLHVGGRAGDARPTAEVAGDRRRPAPLVELVERAAWCGNSVYHDDYPQGRFDARCGACARSRRAIDELLGAARRDPAPPDRYVPDRVERLLTAAKGVMAQFDAITAHQERLLVTGQDLESASANWDDATLGLSIDFSDLKTAIEACEKVPVPPAQAPTP